LLSGRTYDSISTTSGRYAMAVTARRHSGSAQGPVGRSNRWGLSLTNHWLLPYKEAQVLKFFLPVRRTGDSPHFGDGKTCR